MAHAKAWYLWRIVQHEIHLILNSGTQHWLIIPTRVTLSVNLLSEVGMINMCKAMCCTQQAILSLVHVCSVNSKCTLTSLFQISCVESTLGRTYKSLDYSGPSSTTCTGISTFLVGVSYVTTLGSRTSGSFYLLSWQLLNDTNVQNISPCLLTFPLLTVVTQ